MRTLPAEATAELARLTADNLRLRRIEDAARELVAWIKTCPHCDGSGLEPYNHNDACVRCGGIGEITYGDADHEAIALRAALGPEDPASAWRRVRGALSGGGFAP